MLTRLVVCRRYRARVGFGRPCDSREPSSITAGFGSHDLTALTWSSCIWDGLHHFPGGQVAANITHPNILPLFDSGEGDGLLYYTMPYVEGQSLRDRLQREIQLPIEDSVQIAREVADALA